jgi:hypothetical protein
MASGNRNEAEPERSPFPPQPPFLPPSGPANGWLSPPESNFWCSPSLQLRNPAAGRSRGVPPHDLVYAFSAHINQASAGTTCGWYMVGI